MSTYSNGSGFVVLSLLCLSSVALASPAAAQQEALATERMTCGVMTGLQRTTCRTNGSATDVRLVRDLSGGRCRQGETWGYTESYIWTSPGCLAEFQVVYRGGGGGAAAAGAPAAGAAAPAPGVAAPAAAVGTVQQRVTCGASTGQRVTCTSEGTIVSVQLVRDLSGNRCRQNVGWGYTATALWIQDGCIGDFELTVRPAAAAAALVRSIACGSSSGERVQCPTQGDAVNVRLARDLSGGRCREGQSWGHTATFIWTTQACRAEFEVTYRSNVAAPR